MMKKLFIVFFVVVILLTVSACGDNEQSTSNISTTGDKKDTSETVNTKDNMYDSVDNLFGLKMKMGGNYYCTKSGSYHYFYDGETIITYTKTSSENNVSTPKNIDEYESRLSEIFKNRIPTDECNFNVTFSEEKVVNNFKVNELSGTLIDDNGKVHNCKAYTFIIEGRNCIVIAAPIENTDEMIEKMNKDIDIFMNNLVVDK